MSATVARPTKSRLHECARCGKRQTADRMIYSHFTNARYCADVDACGKRAEKRSVH